MEQLKCLTPKNAKMLVLAGLALAILFVFVLPFVSVPFGKVSFGDIFKMKASGAAICIIFFVLNIICPIIALILQAIKKKPFGLAWPVILFVVALVFMFTLPSGLKAGAGAIINAIIYLALAVFCTLYKKAAAVK